MCPNCKQETQLSVDGGIELLPKNKDLDEVATVYRKFLKFSQTNPDNNNNNNNNTIELTSEERRNKAPRSTTISHESDEVCLLFFFLLLLSSIFPILKSIYISIIESISMQSSPFRNHTLGVSFRINKKQAKDRFLQWVQNLDSSPLDLAQSLSNVDVEPILSPVYDYNVTANTRYNCKVVMVNNAIHNCTGDHGNNNTIFIFFVLI